MNDETSVENKGSVTPVNISKKNFDSHKTDMSG
jgi:hypothetical protein